MTETMLAALGGWLLAGFLAFTSFLERRTQQRHGVLLKALEYLTGGSQNRSVGIALIEGLWVKRFPYAESLVPALTNQAVYLLLETESRDGRHQFHNWLRIMKLLLRVPYKEQYFEYYTEVSNALFVRIEDPSHPRGIDMAKDTAEIWFKKINDRALTDSAA